MKMRALMPIAGVLLLLLPLAACSPVEDVLKLFGL